MPNCRFRLELHLSLQNWMHAHGAGGARDDGAKCWVAVSTEALGLGTLDLIP